MHCKSDFVKQSGVAKGEEGGSSYPWVQHTRGTKQPHQKYFNDHKSEFDEVC